MSGSCRKSRVGKNPAKKKEKKNNPVFSGGLSGVGFLSKEEGKKSFRRLFRVFLGSVILFNIHPVFASRIVGTHNTANEVFHCVHFEAPAMADLQVKLITDLCIP